MMTTETPTPLIQVRAPDRAPTTENSRQNRTGQTASSGASGNRENTLVVPGKETNVVTKLVYGSLDSYFPIYAPRTQIIRLPLFAVVGIAAPLLFIIVGLLSFGIVRKRMAVKARQQTSHDDH